MKFFNNLYFVFYYIASSIILPFLIYIFSLINIIDSDKNVFCFSVSVIVFTIVFVSLGILHKGKALLPIVLMLGVKLFAVVFMIIFDEHNIGFFIMLLDLMFVYSKDFLYSISNYTKMDYNLSAAVAFVFSCVYPVLVFAISRLSAKEAKKITDKINSKKL